MDINAKTMLESVQKINDIIISHRRVLHQCPEVGMHLPKTKKYVKDCLCEMGYTPIELCQSGIVAAITGEDSGRCILLRADMDALHVTEKTHLPFRSENKNMHACGHDMHTAMLLGAARLLKQYQSQIKGTVKIAFQPDEEGFTGAKSMIKAGVLKDPVPGAALALHVNSGTPSGFVICPRGTFMAGCTLFRINVQGSGCHGAMPETGVDPIHIAAHICLGLEEIIAREIAAKTPAVVTIGKFNGGQAPNAIPANAVLEGSIRTFDRDLSAKILQRIELISAGIADAFRGRVTVEKTASAPPLINDTNLSNQLAGFATELFGERNVCLIDEGGMGSEDFASYTYEIPCAYLLLGAGTAQENPLFGKPMHNESVVFNEDILSMGAAMHAYFALKWLSSSST